MKKIARRKSDRALFRPSYPDDYCEGQAIADAILGRTSFYFRRVTWRPGRLFPWPRIGHWVETGEIWQPQSGEFDVLEEYEARDLARSNEAPA